MKVQNPCDVLDEILRLQRQGLLADEQEGGPSGILWWMLEEELRLISSERGPKTEMLRIIINFINLAHVLFVYSRI